MKAIVVKLVIAFQTNQDNGTRQQSLYLFTVKEREKKREGGREGGRRKEGRKEGKGKERRKKPISAKNFLGGAVKIINFV